jgi:hypothetical protein
MGHQYRVIHVGTGYTGSKTTLWPNNAQQKPIASAKSADACSH